MRIVGGSFRGKKLHVSSSAELRPTKDRLRESMFNIIGSLGFSLTDQKVADVFAGTGALGFESYSRGANSVTFIDSSAFSLSLIKKNILLFEHQSSFHLYKGRAQSFFVRPNKIAPFNFVFLDPPYGTSGYKDLFLLMIKNNWITQETLIILELPKINDFDASKCQILSLKTYGITELIFFKYPS